MKREKPDCLTCGACCVSLHDQDAFCDVTEEDLKRLGSAMTRRHVLFPSFFDTLCATIDGRRLVLGAIQTRWREVKAGPLKGCEVCACVFLSGSILHRTRCRIYEKRPHACRKALKPGDKSCRTSRRWLRELLLDS